jgi:ribonuclease HI
MQNICWFNGVAQNNGTLSGAGSIIKTGENIIYRSTFNCGMGTNTRDELLGVWASLTLAYKLDIDHLQVLGDSKILVDWLTISVIFLLHLLWARWRRLGLSYHSSKILDLSAYIGKRIWKLTLSRRKLFMFRKGGYTSTNGRMGRRAPHLHFTFISYINYDWGSLVLFFFVLSMVSLCT